MVVSLKPNFIPMVSATSKNTRDRVGARFFSDLGFTHAMFASGSGEKPFRWNLRRVNCDIIRTHPFELIKRNKL